MISYYITNSHFRHQVKQTTNSHMEDRKWNHSLWKVPTWSPDDEPIIVAFRNPRKIVSASTRSTRVMWPCWEPHLFSISAGKCINSLKKRRVETKLNGTLPQVCQVFWTWLKKSWGDFNERYPSIRYQKRSTLEFGRSDYPISGSGTYFFQIRWGLPTNLNSS